MSKIEETMTRIEKAAPIMALIRKHESLGAVEAQGVESPYDVVWSGINREDRPRKLSRLTVSRVLWWQDLIDSRYQSEAAGAYQILEDTLRTLDVNPSALFNAATQDALCLQLLDRRGWAKCERGELSPEAFGNALAKEWASLPIITGARRGESYYGGDGLNAAHATPEEVLAAIREALAAPASAPDPSPNGDDLATRLAAMEAWAASVNAALDRLENRHA